MPVGEPVEVLRSSTRDHRDRVAAGHDLRATGDRRFRHQSQSCVNGEATTVATDIARNQQADTAEAARPPGFWNGVEHAFIPGPQVHVPEPLRLHRDAAEDIDRSPTR